MGESLLTTLSMENHHRPSTFLSMDPTGAPNNPSNSHDDSDRELMMMMALSGPPDINLPLSAEQSSPPQHPWNPADVLDIGPTYSCPQIFDAEASTLVLPNKVGARKCAKRGDSIWGAWFFFSFYFKPVLSDKSKAKINWDGSVFSGFDKSDVKLDVFLVQHDMENMYMWAFKERPENALGKMQLRSYMNGHSRLGEPQFPFSVDKGFVRSHRMQRKQYRGLSNPQCIHGIEVVRLRLPNLMVVSDADRKKWLEITRRDFNFSIPAEASDFITWRNLPSAEFELERPPPPLKNTSPHPRKLLNGSGLNLSNQPSNLSNGDGMDLSPVSSKRRKDFVPNAMEEDLCIPERAQDFAGVMRHAYGPVTATKTIYEDDQGYLIMVSLPFCDLPRVKVSWRNSLTHGVVIIRCVSIGRMPCIKRRDRTFKLTDASPEQCPPGDFIREIPLKTRIPEDAKLEAYYDETDTVLEIMVPKHRVGLEEHEVRVCMRPPHLGANELLLT